MGVMAELFRDFYQLLGVEPFAAEEEIRRAWRRLAKQLHPDRNPDDPLAEQRFKQVQAASRVLLDRERRARYDDLYARRSRRARPNAPGGAPGGGLHRDGGRGASFEGAAESPRRREERPAPGQDLRQVVLLPLERFEGGGRIGVSAGGQPPFDLTLPGVIVPGDELVVPGRGLPGRHGGAPGRLILELRPLLTGGLRLEGSDLPMDLEVDALSLMGGGRLPLRHPAGRGLELNLPAGTQPGQRLRLRGQGLPGRTGRGDLVLEIRARIRPAAGFRAQRLVEKLRRLLDGAD